jgi:hypothetical protein
MGDDPVIEYLPPIASDQTRAVDTAERVSGRPVWSRTIVGKIRMGLTTIDLDQGITWLRIWLRGACDWYIGDAVPSISPYPGRLYLPGIIYPASGISALYIYSATGYGEYILEYGYDPDIAGLRS